ncbi:hypothetical protein DL98DRAFT_591012 [Cadophora sp. DSE1049]|nr:hypothetical protein DL98DRAFT_591012 [Cadophora sp. DSE1049]
MPPIEGETINSQSQDKQSHNIKATDSAVAIPGINGQNDAGTGTGTGSTGNLARCNTTLDYDIWNTCAKDSQPVSVPRQGPCNHCVRDGEAVARRCGIIRCQKCLEECGMTYLLRIRNQRLEGLGYRRVTNGWWKKPGFPGNYGIASWNLVRYGLCTETFEQGENLNARVRERRPI